MKTTILKQAVAAAVLVISASAANAATVTFNFDYLANNGATAANQAGLPIGDFTTASAGTATRVGTITLTDLSDLGLGSGIRSTVTLDNLDQFKTAGSTGNVFISSYELNFAGTGGLTNASFVNVSGLPTSNIEFEENGTLTSSGLGNNWGNKTSSDPAWAQEINFTAGTFVNGQTSTIDFINGEEYEPGEFYNGFSVAALLANGVASQNANLPDAYAWIRIRSTGNAITTADNGLWWQPAITNAAGGRLDVLAVTAVAAAVPEPETYAMMLAGLSLVGFAARRRSNAKA